ncbi:MAG: class B sortase [Eubacterium sp.]
MDNNDINNEKKNNNHKAARTLLIIIALLMIVFGAVYLGYYLYGQYSAGQEDSRLSSIAQTTDVPAQSVENPIDFESLQSKNDEIYAWLKVPGTKIDYPIAQSATDDEFYLRHSAADKSWLVSGAIYTESVNTKSFKDRVTLVYGHNGYSETMFTTLHKFEKSDFFDKHGYFYIYTPDSKLTYQIISAFKYDDRHIMNSFDFQNNNIFNDFLNMIQNPESSNKNIRKELDKELTINDNIVVLSTCFTNQSSSRYLVCGVLVNNEKTD